MPLLHFIRGFPFFIDKLFSRPVFRSSLRSDRKTESRNTLSIWSDPYHDREGCPVCKGDSGMIEARRYQRYAFDNDADSAANIKVLLEGELVRLLNFSVANLTVLSKIPFSLGGVHFSVDLGNRGKIDLMGNIVRVKQEGSMWRIAIDLTETYKLDTLRKV